MRRFQLRKSAPQVRNGTVQHKNDWTETTRHHRPSGGDVVIRRERPGESYRHLLLVRDIERFLTLLPDWDELSQGLKTVVLAPGEPGCFGWHTPGVVAVCAWERELEREWSLGLFLDHLTVLERLGVGWKPVEDDTRTDFRIEFTERSARGFLLMHVLLHELGHHRDRMTTRSRRQCARGEPFAEEFALRYADRLWDRYFDAFGW